MGNEVSNCCGPQKQFGSMPNYAGEMPDVVDASHMYAGTMLSPRDCRLLLHRAAEAGDLQRINQLIKQGQVKVDDTDSRGNTALHKAAWHGHCNACRVLVRHGADVNKHNEVGKTPLHFAQQMGKKACIDFFDSVAALPDPSEVKRKFRKGVKTSNSARIFGPRRSLVETMGLIPGVPHEPEQNQFLRTETAPAVPVAQPEPATQRPSLYEMPATDHDINNGYKQPIRKVNLVKCPQLEIPAKKIDVDPQDDAFLSGRDTHRAERLIREWGDVRTAHDAQKNIREPQRVPQDSYDHYKMAQQQTNQYQAFSQHPTPHLAIGRACSGPAEMQPTPSAMTRWPNASLAVV